MLPNTELKSLIIETNNPLRRQRDRKYAKTQGG